MKNELGPRRLVKWLLVGIGLVAVPITSAAWSAEPGRSNPLRPANQRPETTSQRSVGKTRVASLQEIVAAPPTEDSGAVQQAAYQAPATRRTAVRTASLGRGIPRHAPRSFVPRHQQLTGYQGPGAAELEPIPVEGGGEFGLGELPGEGEFFDPACGVDGVAPCGTCGAATGCLIPCPQALLARAEFSAGVHGFTGPVNRGETGSFGFDWGVNWAAPMPCSTNQAFGVQFGYRGTSSNFSGASFTTDTRNQTFLTGGLFRRVDWGLQGGVVYDYLYDEWYMDASVSQLRGEISWVYPQCHEVGFWFAAGVGDDTVQSTLLDNNSRLTTGTEQVSSTDLYAFFYRRRFQQWCGGVGRIYAGFTGNSDGLIGADFQLPLSDDWAVQSGFTYLIPESGNNRVALQEEAWNLGIRLVWYPGQRKATGNDYFRPLFDVADNGSMILQRN